MQHKTVPISGIKAGPSDGLDEGEFVVYPSTFTRTPDSYGDVIAKGAFAENIKDWKESGNTMPGLYGHRMDDPHMFVASATDMGEDDHGWWVKGTFDLENPTGNQVYKLVKGRRLNQLSFAYDTQDEGSVELDDGTKANELRKVKAYEFSFVPVGANQDTSVMAIKSMVEEMKAGRVLAAKHVQKLRDAHTSLAEVIAAAEDAAADEPKSDEPDTDTSAPSGAKESPDDEASAARPVNDEEPDGAKSEEPSGDPSVTNLAANEIQLLALKRR